MTAAETIATPLELVGATVAPEWIDYNGHMNEAYYVLVFSLATDALMDLVGIDERFRARTGLTLYTLETHVRYLAEARLGARLAVATRLLDCDDKRVHLWHEMRRADGGTPLATAEQMLIGTDTRGPRAAPLAPGPAACLRAILAAHARLPRPEGTRGCLAIRRKEGRP